MKNFILLLALAVLCTIVAANFHDVNVNKVNTVNPARTNNAVFRKKLVKRGAYGSYGSGVNIQRDIVAAPSGYGGRIEIVKPVQPIAMDRPVVSGYGQQVVQPAPALDIPVAPVQTGYGAQQPTPAPIVMDIPRPPVVQSYGPAPIVMDIPRPPVVQSYGPAPVVMDIPRPPVVQSYGATHSTIALDDSTLILEPEYQQMCLNRQNGAVFYFPHPTRKSWFIQCDDFGQAFLKQCPGITVFTQNLVCENPDNLLPIDGHDTAAVQPVAQLDQRVGSYGAAPSFSLDTGAQVQSHVEVIVEAPEFRHLCLNRNAYGAQVSTVFYVPHPTKQSWYIQCDEFGRAFLKECPVNTIFTANLVCERIGEIHTVETTPVVHQQLDRPVVQETAAYGKVTSLPVSLDNVIAPQIHNEVIVEAPEYRKLCVNKNTISAQVSTVFYVPHPTKQSWYIQCDEFGRAFLKECPANTIFTSNLACENVNDLHTAERETVVKQALDQVSGSYGAAPTFSQDSVVSTQSQAHVEVIVEAPEFRSLCTNRNTYGAQISSVFYVAHPTDRHRYIQCNEFGNSYLKECPAGTVFTANLVCELL